MKLTRLLWFTVRSTEKYVLREKMLEMIKKYPVLAERITEEERQRRIAQDPDYRKAHKELTEATQSAWDEANRIQNDKARELRRDLDRKEEVQQGLATWISMISPLSNLSQYPCLCYLSFPFYVYSNDIGHSIRINISCYGVKYII